MVETRKSFSRIRLSRYQHRRIGFEWTPWHAQIQWLKTNLNHLQNKKQKTKNSPHLLPSPPPHRNNVNTNTNTEEPQSSLPTVLRDVTPLGTRMNGTYAAVWVFLTFAGLYAGEWNMLGALVRTLDAKYKRKNRHIEAYVACREIHANPADPLRNHHLHVLIKSNARLEHNNQNYNKNIKNA